MTGRARALAVAFSTACSPRSIRSSSTGNSLHTAWPPSSVGEAFPICHLLQHHRRRSRCSSCARLPPGSQVDSARTPRWLIHALHRLRRDLRQGVEKMTNKEYSGELECSVEAITYRSGIGGWSVPISAIRLIAEYTNSDGPWIDDYFLVFLTAPKDGWHEASFYAKGREAALHAIEKKIGAPIDCGLCDSTEYRTRIIWPPDLKDQALMDVVPPKKQSLWPRLTDSGARDIVLSAAARRAFTR